MWKNCHSSQLRPSVKIQLPLCESSELVVILDFPPRNIIILSGIEGEDVGIFIFYRKMDIMRPTIITRTIILGRPAIASIPSTERIHKMSNTEAIA